ncbi:major facilitator superfamily domain-containing protein [Penicillium sp. IBT 35674x]|nr:major facilitator superfamily domain-containing protein [Penicillium sp. IBT 35674x]
MHEPDSAYSAHFPCRHWMLHCGALRTRRNASGAVSLILAGYYLCFVGANIVAITYLLDSYPGSSGPLLVMICAFRGFISFGTSYGTSAFVTRSGYDGAFGNFGALTAVLGLLSLPVYFWGKDIRHFTGSFTKSKTKLRIEMAEVECCARFDWEDVPDAHSFCQVRSYIMMPYSG